MIDLEKDVDLTFEEYEREKAEARDAVINDYAVCIYKKAKSSGANITIDEAVEIAKERLPMAYVPEWVKNLRASGNLVGTLCTAVSEINNGIKQLIELQTMAHDKDLDAYFENHRNDFHRIEDKEGE